MTKGWATVALLTVAAIVIGAILTTSAGTETLTLPMRLI